MVLFKEAGGVKLSLSTKRCETDGTITVFLSLILLIILSLLFTVIEGARVYTARVMAERALVTAMDSVLAQYYGPLWEEYHIFGYYCEGEPVVAQQVIQNELSDHIAYTLNPEVGLKNNYTTTRTELYHLSLKNIRVGKEVSLLDYDGQILINEAVEYMKYYEIGQTAEILLQNLNLLQTPNKVSYLMEEKQKLQDELVQIDKSILKLMMLFDGIETSDTGIKLTKQGTLKTTDYFIKKICNQQIDMQQVGINQKDVFTALKDHYINMDHYFRQIEMSFSMIEENKLVIQTAREQIAAEAFAMAEISRSLSALPTKSGDEEQDEEQLNGIVRQLQALQESIQGKEALVAAKEKEIIDCENHVKTISKSLLSIIQNTNLLITDAIDCINQIQRKIKVAAPLVNNYEKLILLEKEGLDTSIYSGLEEGINELKRYVGVDNLGYNFDEMKQILEKNRNVLKQTESKMAEGVLRLSTGYHQSSALFYKGARECINTYQIKGLALDYSTLVLDKSNQDSLLDQVKELTASGLVSLVIDTSSLSKANLNSTKALPSELASLSPDSTDITGILKNFFQKTGKEISSSNSERLFQSFGNETSVDSILLSGVNKIAEIYLFEEYLKEHFNQFEGQTSRPEQVTQGIKSNPEKISGAVNNTLNINGKPSVLKYEQEYLITGKASDQENLYAVIMKIMFIRTILNFITVISDSSAREKAKIAAITIVGFTGLPILIGAVQILLLIAWALEEALFDTCAILNQKEVPFIKRKITLQFHELFMVSRAYLEKKVQGLSSSNEISFSYQQYLQLFLLMNNRTSLSYRAMDLMQENIKIRYEVDTFEIEDCYFGFFAEADYRIEPVFTKFSFVQNYIDRYKDSFSFHQGAEYSY